VNPVASGSANGSKADEKQKIVIGKDDLVDSPEAAHANGEHAVTNELPAVAPAQKSNGNGHAPVIAPPAKPGAKPTANGNGRPPHSPGGETEDRSWFGRHGRKLLIAAGAVVALAGSFVVAFVVLGLFDSSKQQVADALDSSDAIFTASTADVRQAGKEDKALTALRDSAISAGQQADEIDAEMTSLTSSVDDGRLVNPAVDLMTAERDYLSELATIADFRDQELKQSWNKLEPKLAAGERSVNSASDGVTALDLGSATAAVPSNEQMETSVDTADEILIESDRILSEWRARVARLEAERDEQLTAAREYQSSMPGLIETYFEQREQTQELMDRPRVPWMEASRTLRSQSSARTDTIGSMESLVVPEGLESAHDTMVGLATEGRDILDTAAETTETDPFIIWTGSPGYERMSAASDSISSRYEPAKAGVVDGVAGLIEELENQQLPPKPQL
jgi:hypothetical protein